jgi:uncharacterized protein (DUF2236 family)
MNAAASPRVGASRDEGYFPEGSILRRIHSERAVGLFYGQRALMIGALNPLTFVGTLLHTNARLKPFQRLSHTAEVFETIFFDTKAEADKMLAFVDRLHQRVKGEMPEDAGAVKAGTPYSAFDPELMLWTMAVIADSGPFFYELFVGELSDEEHEQLWQDYVRFAELFGMPRSAAPATHREFREWFDGKLASDEMHLTPEAHEIGYATAFEIPMPAYRAPAKAVHDLIMLGALPERVRELYGIPYSRRQQVAFRAVVRGLRGARPVTPRSIRQGYNTGHFRMVARTERRRLERGDPTPQASPAAKAATELGAPAGRSR